MSLGRVQSGGTTERSRPDIALSLIAVAALVGFACAPTDPQVIETTPPPPVSTTTVTTSPSTTTTTLTPEEAHVFEGRWLLTYTLETVSENFSASQDQGDRDLRVVNVSPSCEMGPCDVEIEFSIPYLEESIGTFSATWSGEAYDIGPVVEPGAGICRLEDGTVIEDGLDLITSLELEPTEFVASESGWAVGALIGRRVFDWTPTPDAAARGCAPSAQEYSVMGAPYDPGQFEIPSSLSLPTGSVFYFSGREGLVAHLPDGTQPEMPHGTLQYALSPDGGSVVYGGGVTLRVMALDGSGDREILSNARLSPASDLAWSPDGSKVAFVRVSREGGADVWYVEVPYGVPHRVTFGGFAMGGVTWGPRGDTLLFDWGISEKEALEGGGSSYQYTSTIYSHDLVADESSELVAYGFRPSIGAGGTVLSYLVPDLLENGQPFRWRIVLADPDGSSPRTVLLTRLTNCDKATPQHARGTPCSVPVSPGGDSLVFSNSGKFGGPDAGRFYRGAFNEIGVWIWDLASGEGTAIADSGWSRPQWSP